MLIENNGYQFSECTVSDSKIQQQVKVLTGNQEFSLTYTLSVNGSTLGVDSAVISDSASQISA
jgi:hypothetical protein